MWHPAHDQSRLEERRDANSPLIELRWHGHADTSAMRLSAGCSMASRFRWLKPKLIFKFRR